MNEELMRKMGFGDEVDKAKAGKCPFCSKKVDPERFRDECSRREFRISGLCQGCQDETFGGGG